MLWAGDITPQQALEKARIFMEQREHNGSRQHRTPGVNVGTTTTEQVGGLYVVNMAEGGYVVVSGDDRTLPILGFGDTGAIDTNAMPTNMAAWLQGYADEIAWLNSHGKTTVATPRHVGSHSTAEIYPMVTTQWDQRAPYNNLCPKYSEYDQAVTGCVATAMAQVMNYHQQPATATQPIPGYTTESYGLELSGLPAVTFDWANMSNTYTEASTGPAATAVATLMQYCGWAVEMDYGPSSGSTTDAVAYALKTYFGYSETTQYVSRSYYTAAKWADLIYHELANGRPVVYGGMSSGGGHEFVCDGYQYENNTDYFHINWGWGGTSDNYFVLSALDPEVQGAGGSSSTDGYHYGQDAVIGIQKSTGTGTIADITPNDINLTINSMTPSNNPAMPSMVTTVTINVTNNGAEDYEGDIYLGWNYEGSYELGDGEGYIIPAGETKEISFRFVPKNLGTYNMVIFLPGADGGYTTDGTVYATIEVISAETNNRIPIYGKYCDEYSQSQFIIPATDLQDMLNTSVNGVTFYAITLGAIIWEEASFDVYLKEVANTTFANTTYEDWTTMTKVYSGPLSIDNNGRMAITFDNPYWYQGGNLLVGINQMESADEYIGCTWVGTTVAGASLGGNEYNTGVQQQNFLPMYTFDYTILDGIEATTTMGADKKTAYGWYTIDGRKLSGKPTIKGIYLQVDSDKAKKVVVMD